ncbi:reverse transcriptase domain-containing protein [Caerostris darwini]|uniref:Reverse transcriptase domain-containing protein n=1 Tax=Caerostris darwini TaxID=1538125 RepID=A0AAV4STF1_9ARAC|nr:reverse transcriptase domain-containing protein [Caerostris darwini]
MGDYRCGFRKGRSTVDQIFTLRQILEKCREYGMETHHLFIDFCAAYDSIDQLVKQALADFAVPQKLINSLKLIFTNALILTYVYIVNCPGLLRLLMVLGEGMVLHAFYLQ